MLDRFVCVCDCIEWRSGQIADDKWGNGPNGEKKWMCVNMDVSPRHRRWQEGYNVPKWLTVHVLFMQSCWSERERERGGETQTNRERNKNRQIACSCVDCSLFKFWVTAVSNQQHFPLNYCNTDFKCVSVLNTKISDCESLLNDSEAHFDCTIAPYDISIGYFDLS